MSVELIKEENTINTIRELVTHYGKERAELIPILQDINAKHGYISPDAIKELSLMMNIPTNEIFTVATFYRMLSTKPRGKHLIQFCNSAPCHVVGGRQVWLALKKELGLESDETSKDNKWTLQTTSCLGVCGIGPVLVIDQDIYGNVLPEQVKNILSRYE
ncbi:MAG: NADH-quinone oxidoreductase subunit NuoE [Anaerolineaceae bacterium]|nr:NADH-quinone oxidoreductase subunit NuoE [Anaerolineaceae bacterium]